MSIEGTFLAIVDADRIQDYIFAPRQLKLIRGASAIQRDLNLVHSVGLLREYGPGNLDDHGNISEERRLELDPSQRWEIVYAGGGNLYVLFRDGDPAKKFTNAACSLYRKHGVSASATGGVVPWANSFKLTLQAAQDAVMARKTSAATPAEPLSSPYWKICEACGVAPATHWSRNALTGERILCCACQARRGNSEHAPYLDEIASDLRPPQDFEVIAGCARPENYLALVYIDVDKLGRFFDGIEPLAQIYRKHSFQIRDTIREGVIAGCRAACVAIPAGSHAPLEILLLGGDDAIVMLAAQAVSPFLRSFREIFGEKLPALSFSAGVVWAHHHLPIAQYTYHAKKLLRSAKAAGGGRIDYLVVSESMVSGRDKSMADRTLRPYSFEDFDHLFETIAGWKREDFPSNKAHQLYRMAFEEENQGTVDFLYWISRLDQRHRDAACRFFSEGLWQQRPRRATAAADLAELWDFVEVV